MGRKKELSYQTEGDVFATRLREVMEERGENQTTLAAKITKQSGTIQRQSISQYMQGQSKPDTVRLAAICKALNVSADYLIDLSDYKSTEHDVRACAEYTGLTENAISRIRTFYLFSEKSGVLPEGFKLFGSMNDFLSSENGAIFISKLAKLGSIAELARQVSLSMPRSFDKKFSDFVYEREKDINAALFELTLAAQDIANELFSLNEVREAVNKARQIQRTLYLQEKEQSAPGADTPGADAGQKASDPLPSQDSTDGEV